MSKIPLVFFGTQHFAAQILQGLLDSEQFEISLVITQPDQPSGRHQILAAPPTKLLAQKYNIAVAQPETLKNFSFPEIPDQQSKNQITICAQYGKLIPPAILEAFPLGILNVHTSLLPKYRGASPIQSSILAGETETGVTIMKMAAGLDTGPILAQTQVEIAPDDLFTEVENKLIGAAIPLLIESTQKYLAGEITPSEQNENQMTACRELTKDDGKVNWNQTAEQIYNQYRALCVWPGIWTKWNEKRLKLIDLKPADKKIPAGQVKIEEGRIFIGTSNGALEILSLQLEGKNTLTAADWLRGNAKIDGANLLG